MRGSGGFQVLCLELEPDLLMSCSTTGVRFVLIVNINIFPIYVTVGVVVISQRLCRSHSSPSRGRMGVVTNYIIRNIP